MINFNNIVAFAQAERRLTTRLTRYWIFIFLSYLMSIGMLIYKSVWHAFGSSVSASAGLLSPRYNIAESGSFYLLIFIVGIIFLAFDVRARDSRERMLEILDSRPYATIELVFGRFSGLFLAAWVPVLVLVLLIQVLGWLLPNLGSPFGSTIEPYSLLSYPFVIALPAMAFICALVIFITLLVRNRFVAMLASGVIIVGLFFFSGGMFSYPVSSAIDLTGFYQVNISSDWVPSIAMDDVALLQRFGIILLTPCLLIFAALVHPRLEEKTSRNHAFGAVAVTLACVFLLTYVYSVRNGEFEVKAQWLQAHKDQASQPVADIIAMQASVNIDPGQGLSAQVDLEFKAPVGQSLNKAIFSLNPGFNITAVKDSSGTALTHQFDQGLLSITLNTALNDGQSQHVQLTFDGAPDNAFGYLDSAVEPMNITSSEPATRGLGLDNAVFSSNYVALMPAIHWLPSSGVDVARDDNRLRLRDFFKLNLNVTVPSDWTLAGPGLRTEGNRDNDTVEYSFAPQTKLAEVALLGAPFKQFSTTIDGIVFEMLLHPDHLDNIEILAKGEQQLKTWVADKLALAKQAGLVYPFKAFTLVEVPNTLRGYAGGWQTDTAMAPPSMLLMKESGLPTARFDFDATESLGDGRELTDETDGAGKVVRDRLIEFFANDYTGGNVFTGITRSFFAHQLAGTGPDAVALDYTLNQLATLVISDQPGYFSVGRMFDVMQAMGRTIGSDPKRGRRVAERVMNSFKNDPRVWESALTHSLTDMDPWLQPDLSVDILALKAGGLAQIIYDTLGPDKSGRLLSQLLSTHRGQSFTRADFVAAASVQDPTLDAVIENWFTNTGLAGFVADRVQLNQIPSSDTGSSRYQLQLRIQNDEEATGFTRVGWITELGQPKNFSAPVRIEAKSAIEFGIVLSVPPLEVYLEPYVSLNRKGYVVKQFEEGELKFLNNQPFNGKREVALATPMKRIVVDDLDPNFRIETSETSKGFRLAGKMFKPKMDQGLPASAKSKPKQWSRGVETSAYGKYRHTLAYVFPGDGNSKAVFPTTLPKSGSWSLDIYLPNIKHVTFKRLGNMELTITSSSGTQSVIYNTDDTTVGWNTIGEFEVPTGDVKVEISDKSSGDLVVADAIAWTAKL